MTQATLEKASVQAAGQPARLYFADHLRAALAILVVLHHIAIVYGASSPFYYVEPPFEEPVAFKSLLVFVLFNQAWFMGAFFFLAGYFTPGSYDRKGPGSFLRERLVRLGIPILIFTFVLSPIASLGSYLMPTSLTGITDPPTWQAYPDMIGLGPLWFVAMLLVFSLGYSLWRKLTGDRTPDAPGKAAAPGYLLVGFFILALALVSFLFRMIVPLGQEVSVFVYFLSFPTIAYLPQYLSFFILGI
ncbi:MAG: acyltransferase family protein, partial [Anaerolineae bacterium]|nr:acyltransferase family protein [Anaerolineae bacterium]